MSTAEDVQPTAATKTALERFYERYPDFKRRRETTNVMRAYTEEEIEHMKAKKQEWVDRNIEYYRMLSNYNRAKNYEKHRLLKMEKVPCPECGKILSRGSLYLHNRIKHPKIEA